MLSAASLLLSLCLSPDVSAQNYDKQAPLTLLNRSVLDRSRKAIQRDDISTRSAIMRLVLEADQLMQHPVPSPTASDTRVLKTVCSEARTLGEAYYLTGQEKYAARVYDYIRPWLTDPATRIPPQLSADTDFAAMSDIIDMLDEALDHEALGFAIVLKGQHMCKSMRGVKNPGAMSVSYYTGIFKQDAAARNEFLQMIKMQ